MSAVERASELGTAHGVLAAEVWWATAPVNVQLGVMEALKEGPQYLAERFNLPVPDLSGDIKAFYAKVGLQPPAFRGPVAPAEGESIDAWDSFYAMSDKWETFDMECQDAYDAYGSAFTAAVETTVREATQ